MTETTPACPPRSPASGIAPLLAAARAIPLSRWALGACLSLVIVWAYAPTLNWMARKWVDDPQYSHGYLVPVFALALLYLRRDKLTGFVSAGHTWGIGFVVLGAVLRIVAVYRANEWLDGVSLIPTLAGLTLLTGGASLLRWSWPALAFLIFMVPLPYRIETALAHPLQTVATVSSTWLLQTIGLPAVAEGNTILLPAGKIGVVEACSGLSMLLIFVALATAMVMLVRRPWIDQGVILLSSVPVAIIANTLRITVTGVAQECINPELAHAIFHDWAGWLMMPLALGMLALEGALLARCFPETGEEGPLPGPGTLRGSRLMPGMPTRQGR